MADVATMRWLRRALVLVGATLLAMTVSAQGSDAVVPMPVWDASGSVAANNIRASEAQRGGDARYDYWESQWEPGAQFGRYLATHLKIEIGVRGPASHDFYESDRVPAPALSAPLKSRIGQVSLRLGVGVDF